jgi:hypothetical protein
VSIQPALGLQLAVPAAFDDPSAVHHQDQIRRQDGAQAVGDDDAGAPGDPENVFFAWYNFLRIYDIPLL